MTDTKPLNERPYQKAFTVGGILFAILTAAMAASGTKIEAYGFGCVAGEFLVPALCTGIHARNSKKTWGWGSYIAWFIVWLLIIAFVKQFGGGSK